MSFECIALVGLFGPLSVRLVFGYTVASGRSINMKRDPHFAVLQPMINKC